MLGNAYVRITNNFLHDMATGTWAACLMVLAAKRRALIVKHIAFLLVYGGGTVWGWLLLP